MDQVGRRLSKVVSSVLEPAAAEDTAADGVAADDAEARAAARRSADASREGQELVHKYRYVDSGGYYDRQIQGMVADGWNEDAAAAVRMLPAFGGIALGRALKMCDVSMAASLHAVANGIAARASETPDFVAPPLYAPMSGFPELQHYGLCDQDPAAEILARSQMHTGATMAAISPPLTLRDDPQLMSEHGMAMYHYDASVQQGRYLQVLHENR